MIINHFKNFKLIKSNQNIRYLYTKRGGIITKLWHRKKCYKTFVLHFFWPFFNIQ